MKSIFQSTHLRPGSMLPDRLSLTDQALVFHNRDLQEPKKTVFRLPYIEKIELRKRSSNPEIVDVIIHGTYFSQVCHSFLCKDMIYLKRAIRYRVKKLETLGHF